MTGEPSERKPSTSSGELPPTQTVALKASRSRPDRRSWNALICHDGSGTRSGSAAAGGFARYGTPGSGESPRARAGAVFDAAAAQHPPRFTTVSLTLAVASAAVMCSTRTNCGEMVAVTLYLPGASRTVGGGKLNENPDGSAAQPRARPMTRLFGNGSKPHPGGYGFVTTLSGTARCGPKLGQNSGRVEATTLPVVSATDRRRKSRSPLKPSSRLLGRDLVVVPPPGRWMTWVSVIGLV